MAGYGRTYVTAAPTNPLLSAWRKLQTRVAERAHYGLEDIRLEARTPDTLTDQIAQASGGISPHTLRRLAGGARVLFSGIGGGAEAAQEILGTPGNDEEAYRRGIGDLAEAVAPIPGEGAVGGVNALMRGARRVLPRAVEAGVVPAERVAAAVRPRVVAHPQPEGDGFSALPRVDTVQHMRDMETMPLSDGFNDLPRVDTAQHAADTRKLAETMPIQGKRGELEVRPFDRDGTYYGIHWTTQDGRRVTGTLEHIGDGKASVNIDFNGVNPNDLGIGAVRDMATALKKRFPELQEVGGIRISGARGRGQFDENGRRLQNKIIDPQTFDMNKVKLGNGQPVEDMWPEYHGQDEPAGDGFIQAPDIPTTPTAANDEPLTVYHGGAPFDPNHPGPTFFAPSEDIAHSYATSDYATGEGRPQYVTAAHVSINNPAREEQVLQAAKDIDHPGGFKNIEFHGEYFDQGMHGEDAVAALKARLQGMGHDGVILPDTGAGGSLNDRVHAYIPFDNKNQVHVISSKNVGDAMPEPGTDEETAAILKSIKDMMKD